MSEVQTKLLDRLCELEGAVARRATADPKSNLVALFEQIDALAQQLPSSTHPTLLHYLRKRSYEKARLFLQGREAENAVGNCGHVE